MKIPEYILNRENRKDTELMDFIDRVRKIINFGRYQMRIVTSVPTWSGDEGEHLIYILGAVRRFYFWDSTNSTWQYIEWSGSGATDHGALGGLTDDDHTQYFLLAGETTDAKLYSGADFKVYSDAGITLQFDIDGATGTTTIQNNTSGINLLNLISYGSVGVNNALVVIVSIKSAKATAYYTSLDYDNCYGLHIASANPGTAPVGCRGIWMDLSNCGAQALGLYIKMLDNTGSYADIKLEPRTTQPVNSTVGSLYMYSGGVLKICRTTNTWNIQTPDNCFVCYENEVVCFENDIVYSIN